MKASEKWKALKLAALVRRAPKITFPALGRVTLPTKGPTGSRIQSCETYATKNEVGFPFYKIYVSCADGTTATGFGDGTMWNWTSWTCVTKRPIADADGKLKPVR